MREENAVKKNSILKKNAAELSEKIQKIFNKLYTYQSVSSYTEKKTETEITYQSLFYLTYLIL